MNKNMFENEEEKLLISKIMDKYNFCKRKNKITNTDFLNVSQISKIKKFLKTEKIENYVLYGGRENSDRKILIFFPEKFSQEIINKNIKKIIEIVRIELPKDIKYEYRDYLSGIMKLGIKREKYGDIIVSDKRSRYYYIKGNI